MAGSTSSRSVVSYATALRDAIAEEMRRDEDVIVLGEDVAGGKGRGPGGRSADAWGGSFGKTRKLCSEFGEDRVFDTPVSETGFLGMATAAAACGLRPVVDACFSDFLGVCFDQVLNQIPKLRYMSDGQVKVPLVVSVATGGGVGAGGQHSSTLYSLFTHLAGLKVVAPATPADAKGLMAAAIRDDDPVFVFEHKRLYGVTGEVPTGEHLVPLGKANVVRSGSDVTIIGISATVQLGLDAAEDLANDGIDAEVVDLRSLSPWDIPTLVESVAKTRRLVVVDEAGPRCGMASDIAARLSSDAFEDLAAPVRMVTAAHVPPPFSPALEEAVLPSKDGVIGAVREVVEFDAGRRRPVAGAARGSR